jgi:pilus assembly protein Flp/PilA
MPSLHEEGPMRRLIALLKDSRGATAIEYGLIVSLITIAVIAAISAVGGNMGRMYNNVAATMP